MSRGNSAAGIQMLTPRREDLTRPRRKKRYRVAREISTPACFLNRRRKVAGRRRVFMVKLARLPGTLRCGPALPARPERRGAGQPERKLTRWSPSWSRPRPPTPPYKTLPGPACFTTWRAGSLDTRQKASAGSPRAPCAGPGAKHNASSGGCLAGRQRDGSADGSGIRGGKVAGRLPAAVGLVRANSGDTLASD